MPDSTLQGTINAFPIDKWSIGTDDSKISGSGVAGDPLSIAPDAITAVEIAPNAVGTSELASTTVTPGSYTNADITVDADGRITAAANGTTSTVSQLTDLTDVNTATPTAGNILVGDGVDFESVGISGDITMNSSGVTTLATDSVVTNNITASNVTYAKIQDMSASTLLGNPTGGAAAPSEITLGTGLQFNGTAIEATTSTQLPTREVLIGDVTKDIFAKYIGTQPVFTGDNGAFTLTYDSSVTDLQYLQFNGNDSDSSLSGATSDFTLTIVDTNVGNILNQTEDDFMWGTVSVRGKGNDQQYDVSTLGIVIKNSIPLAGREEVLISGLAGFAGDGFSVTWQV